MTNFRQIRTINEAAGVLLGLSYFSCHRLQATHASSAPERRTRTSSRSHLPRELRWMTLRSNSSLDGNVRHHRHPRRQLVVKSALGKAESPKNAINWSIDVIHGESGRSRGPPHDPSTTAPLHACDSSWPAAG